jgi:hypothetical protein
MAVSNRTEDFSNVQRLALALRNRAMNLNLMSSHKDWLDWANANGIHEWCRGFIRFKPTLLNAFQAAKTAEERRALMEMKAINTERTWHKLSDALHAGVDKEIEHGVAAGLVGPGAGHEFFAYVKYYRELPDMDAYIKDPSIYRVKDVTEPAILWAVATGISARIDTEENDTVRNAFRIFSDLPKDYATAAIRDAVATKTSLIESEHFTKWVLANPQAMEQY